MSYASDYDDFEQSAQGEDCGESGLESLCEEMFGRPMYELSCKELANLNWQFKQDQKKGS